jgi:CheY-like chemotaxis protein
LARKILLADDSVTAQNMGRKILADAGYDVVTVNNGSAALKRIAELKPDLIVLDVYMPGYSGLEVCQRLKDAPETMRIPVLLTVGKLEPFKAEEARRVRADAHIVKPFEASELLTAITRLEERMVPPQAPENDASPETGWSSRLSFPPKKKKEKAEEPEEVGNSAAFRDFPREKSKTGGELAAKVAAAKPGPDRVPDIPEDVTPEELDALSALAAKLDGLTPAGANTATPATHELATHELATHEQATYEHEVETPASAVESAEMAAEATFAVEPATFAVEGTGVEATAVEATVAEGTPISGTTKSEIPVDNKLPVENIEPVIERIPVVELNTAHEPQEPAPVDRNDEPLFASATSTVGPAEAETETAGKPSEAEEAAPTDTELNEALRWLTPAAGHTDVSTVPAYETSALPAEVAAHDGTSPRWVAEPVTLSPEEAAISLEAEMFRTFAAMPTSSSGTEIESGQININSVSAIAAAVENRLAKAEAEASSKVLADGAESCSEPAVQEIPAEEAPAEAMATVSQVDGDQAEKTEHQDSPVKVAEQVPPEELPATPQEALKAMAAAATDGATSAGDAGAIANIVDSVLADLRPKLLEEITKKLARK